jgi:hypothetical protein
MSTYSTRTDGCELCRITLHKQSSKKFVFFQVPEKYRFPRHGMLNACLTTFPSCVATKILAGGEAYATYPLIEI